MAITLVPYVQEKTVSITPDIRFVSDNYSQGYTATAFEPAYNFRQGGSGYALYIDENNYIKINCQTSGYLSPSCEIKYDGVVIGGSTGGGYVYGSSLFCGLSVDDETQLGYCTYIVIGYGSYTQYCQSILVAEVGSDARHKLYNLIKMAIPPTYNWQSVPSISGKNGILSLAQIKEEYINEGESVSGASADHFTNLSSENRVDVLIDAALPDQETGGTTVTVKYTIPSLSIGSYEYCKLVAKKNSIPEGPEDGDKIINIDPSLVSAVARGLDGLSTYYFVIFIEDDQGNTASSEPKSCETGRGSNWRCLTSIKVNGINCPLLQINDFSIIPNTYGGAATLIRRQSGIYTPSGVSDLGSEFAQPTISSGIVEKSTNYNNVIFRTTFGYNAQAQSNFNQNEIIYNTNTALMSHGFLLATEVNTRLYIGIALNDAERYGCCYFVAQYPDRNWTTENYSGGDGEIGYLIYSIFGNS